MAAMYDITKEHTNGTTTSLSLSVDCKNNPLLENMCIQLGYTPNGKELDQEKWGKFQLQASRQTNPTDVEKLPLMFFNILKAELQCPKISFTIKYTLQDSTTVTKRFEWKEESKKRKRTENMPPMNMC